MGKIENTTSRIKMQSRNTSLVLLLCLSLALTFREAQQVPVNNYEFNWSHSKKIDIESIFANSKKWYDATKDVQTKVRNEDSEGEESLFDMDFPMEPLVSDFSDSHFSLYINGKEYQPEEMIEFAKKIFEDNFHRTSLSKFTDEKQVLDPNEIPDMVEPFADFLLLLPVLSVLPLLLVIPMIIFMTVFLPLLVVLPFTMFLPFVPLLVFLPFLADFATIANVATVANTVANVTTVANITTIAPTVVSTIANTIANEIINLPKSI